MLAVTRISIVQFNLDFGAELQRVLPRVDLGVRALVLGRRELLGVERPPDGALRRGLCAWVDTSTESFKLLAPFALPLLLSALLE